MGVSVHLRMMSDVHVPLEVEIVLANFYVAISFGFYTEHGRICVRKSMAQHSLYDRCRLVPQSRPPYVRLASFRAWFLYACGEPPYVSGTCGARESPSVLLLSRRRLFVLSSQEVYRLHADWLYSKRLFDKALRMYIKTIGMIAFLLLLA